MIYLSKIKKDFLAVRSYGNCLLDVSASEVIVVHSVIFDAREDDDGNELVPIISTYLDPLGIKDVISLNSASVSLPSE
jgi:hypothetical protein